MGHINTDIPELKGYDTGTVLCNLERLCRRSDDELEALAAHLYELAEAIRHDAAGDLETVDTILRAFAAEELTVSSSKEASHRKPDVERLTAHMGIRERLILYRAIIELQRNDAPTRHSPRKGRGRRATTPVSAMAKGRIAYMPNTFADQAYAVLSRDVSARRGGTPCRAAHCHSFAEGCEEVARGQCEYCILPLENSVDGKLVGFYRLMVEHGLFITAVCDVENHALTDRNVTRFALLSQTPSESEGTLTASLRRQYVEVLHTSASAASLTDLLVAATFCGLRLCRIDTLPMTDGSLPVCGAWETHDADDTDLAAFLGYLTLEASDDRVMGLYDKI